VVGFAAAAALVGADASYGSVWIRSGPQGTVASDAATFRFAGPRGSAFRCRLDGRAAVACTSPKRYASLADGRHRFELRNSASTQVDVRTWVVDTERPAAPAIRSAPGSVVGSATARFAFAGERGATFTCKLGAGPRGFTPCTSPKTYRAPRDGRHTFQVRQRDAAGNVSGAATHRWTVDTRAPRAPALRAATAAADASFEFAGERAASFRCGLDGAARETCTSPRVYAGLGAGEHVFAVWQYDAAGNQSPPATHRWSVVAATVEWLEASCAGDVLYVRASAAGPVGASFEIAVYVAPGGQGYGPTGRTASFTLAAPTSTRYSHTFDLSGLGGASYKAVSSTGVESNAVESAACRPGTTIPEAPQSVLLPLSALATLVLGAAVCARRRPRSARWTE
jgi:hypothetical protein